MIALAYLFPPLTGLLVHLRAKAPAARLHGLQSVTFGTVVPILLYLSSWIGRAAAQVTFVVSALAWLLLLLSGLARRTPLVPLLRRAEGLVRDET